jgi:murein L,D-transpeptidase YafK
MSFRSIGGLLVLTLVLVVFVLGMRYGHRVRALGRMMDGKKDRSLIAEHRSLQHIADSIYQATKVHPTFSLYVRKKDRIMEIRLRDKAVKSYRVCLGFQPEGDKMQEGDGATPEGHFQIKAKYPHKSWNKFMWIDYPSATSWKRFKDRKAQKTIPESARIGGEIGIHGTPKDADYLIEQKIDWTLGCISLTNQDIDDFYPFVKVGTKLEIVP